MDYEKANKIDLIIMGCEGLRGISKLKALGSVSRKISDLAKCPVMIVRYGYHNWKLISILIE